MSFYHLKKKKTKTKLDLFLLQCGINAVTCLTRYLHGNKLIGPIPPELGNMSKLSYL